MPLIAVAIALVADVGVAAGAITSTFGIIAAVGATVSAVGAVTKNQDLAYAGMALGAVGGLGALASNAGLFSASAADSASGATDASSAFGSDVSQAAPLPGEAAAAGAAPDTDIIDSLGNVDSSSALATSPVDQEIAAASGSPVGDLGLSGLTSGTGSAANGGLLTSGSNLGGDISGMNPVNFSAVTGDPTTAANALPPQQAGIPQGAGQAPAAPGAPFVPEPTPDIAQAGHDAFTPTGLAPSGSSFGQMTSAANQADPGVIGSLTNFAKNNPLASYGVIQAAGSLLAGATSTLTPAQVDALNAQAAANRAAASLSTMQQTNMAGAIPTLTRSAPSQAVAANVTGQPTGLINTPATASTQVTGAPS